jgi:hypothetical protein
LEFQVDAYKNKLSEQMLINDLLKKIQNPNNSAQVNELNVDRNYLEIGSKKKACKVIGISMLTYYYDPKISSGEREVCDADIRGRLSRFV